MLHSVEGIFRDGKVELLELPADLQEARVIVTFLPRRRGVDLQALGISKEKALEFRGRLQTFVEDWERPEMDIYDEM